MAKPQKSFNECCWKLCSKVPKGRVSTYKELANALGTRAYRAAGQAMNKNPFHHEQVPCHRIVMSDGSLGGFAHEISLKIARLKKDGVEVKDGKIVDFKKKFYSFV